LLIIRAGGGGPHNDFDPALLHTIIKLYNESGPVTISDLLKCKPSSSYYNLYRELKRLEDDGLVIEEKLSGLLFFYPAPSAFLWLNNLPKSDFLSLNASNFCTHIDLTTRERESETLRVNLDPQTLLYNLKFQLEYNSKLKASEYWWKVQYINYKLSLDHKDLRKAYLNFSLWLADINQKVLVFMKPDGEPAYKLYKTRFNSLEKLYEREEAWEEAWAKAEKYSFGVGLVLTNPPTSVIPLKIQRIVSSVLRHKIKARLRRRLGFSPPHICSFEPQRGKKSLLSLHSHMYIFGIPFIDFRTHKWQRKRVKELIRALKEEEEGLSPFLENKKTDPFQKTIEEVVDDSLTTVIEKIAWKETDEAKRAFTEYCDAVYEDTLANLGKRIKSTVNKRLAPSDIKKYNRLGRSLLLKYRQYKNELREKALRKGKKSLYTGPVNWLSRIHRTENDWVFENPPPDAFSSQLLKNPADGGKISPKAYSFKYPVKMMRFVKALVQGKKLPKKHKLVVFYWLLRIPFFTLSPQLRDRVKERISCGWKFIGSFRMEVMLKPIEPIT